MSNLVLLLSLLVLGYIVLYLSGRKYLESFKLESENNMEESDKLSQTVYPPDKPYITSQINDLDDYEYSAIFQNQGDKQASKKELNDAMSRYPLDWSTQPPDSQYFQEKRSEFIEQQQSQPAPDTSVYNKIDGSDMTPTDTAAMSAEEKKVLQMYKPESSKGLLSYSLEDVKHLIDRVYAKKGLIPTIEKSKQGPNVYEIVEVQPKDPHIVWEDDLDKMTDRERMTMRSEETIEVPTTVTDMAAGLDPFFNPRTGVKNNKNDYMQWTPGLERMFAPTYPIKNWF
jgi:hypothetical protein